MFNPYAQQSGHFLSKLVHFISLVVLFVGFAAAQGEPKISAPSGIAFPLADFEDGITLNTTLTIKNTGTAVLTVFTITSTNSVFSVLDPIPPFNVSPSSRASVQLQFAPVAPGQERGELHLESNDSNQPVAVVQVFGETLGEDHCDLTTIGVTPLNDMGQVIYKAGHIGGLYPEGTSQRPESHEQLGLQIVENYILPRDPDGEVDFTNGVIGLVSVGMSNTSHEFAGGEVAFLFRANQDPAKNPQVAVVNGALGGKGAGVWADEGSEVWDLLDAAVVNAGLTNLQMQVAWVKHAHPGPANLGEFPTHAEILTDYLTSILRILRSRFPNLRVAYLTSRTRSYTNDPFTLNPEPFAFESGFSVRWLIEKQLNGEPTMDPDPESGVVPWLSWGPYIWADGEVPRSDGFVWFCSDLAADLTHPSMSGRAKVADQLIAFFKTDPTATPWFLRDGTIGQAPQVTVFSDVSSGSAPLTVNYSVWADDPDGSVTEFAWTFGDGGFSLSQNPKKVFPVPGLYESRLTVTDNDGNTTLRTLTVQVEPDGGLEPPAITSPLELPGALVGSEFAVTFSAAGTQPVDWSIISGAVPPGLGLSLDGHYSGTPTEPGQFTFTIQASNAAGVDFREYLHSVADDGGLLRVYSPAADAYVADGTLANQNFGALDVLSVRNFGSGRNELSYLKFDLSNAPCEVDTATLRLFLRRIDRGNQITVHAYSVSDDSWHEGTVTWNNRPFPELQLSSAQLNATGIEYAFDVTSFVSVESPLDPLVSFALLSLNSANSRAVFDSREGPNSPLLEVRCLPN